VKHLQQWTTHSYTI